MFGGAPELPADSGRSPIRLACRTSGTQAARILCTALALAVWLFRCRRARVNVSPYREKRAQMTSNRRRYLCLAGLAVSMACSNDAAFQEAVDSVAVANPELAAVSGENALGALHRALTQSMERAEILQERASDQRLRDLAYTIREERAALLIRVSDEAGLVGVELDPPADSLSTRTPGRALRQAHQRVLELAQGVDSAAFDTTYVAAASEASRDAADLLLSFDAAALSPAVLELVRAAAAALTWEADELSGEARPSSG